MRRAFYLLFFLLCLGLPLKAEYENGRYGAIYDSLWQLVPLSEKIATISGFDFEIDLGKFSFQEGEFIFLNAVRGKTVGLIFHGRATFNLSAPTPVEKFSLKKFTGAEEFHHEFQNAVIFFSPDIFASHFAALTTAPGKISNNNETQLKNFYNRVEEYGIDVGMRLIASLMSSQDGGYFLALLRSKDQSYLYVCDPRVTETVQLYRQKWYGGINLLQPVALLFPAAHYRAGLDPYFREEVKQVEPVKYEIDTRIRDNTKFHAVCRLTLASLIDSLLCFEYQLASMIEIDSVFDAHGVRLTIDDFEETGAHGVCFDNFIMAGDTAQLTFFYHADDAIKRDELGDFYLLASIGWYPLIGYHAPALYDLRFAIPKWLNLFSVGEKVLDSLAGDTLYTRWVTHNPVYFASFNYGYFDSLTVEEPGLPIVKVYRSNPGHTGKLFAPDMLEITGRDVLAALQFCINLFGPYPYPHILVTEIPYFARGQSFPGLLHLGWLSFEEDIKAQGYEADAFRAHETSHQWWGHIVGWKSYHDQWLSEAFAEYTGAWFIQTKDGNNKRFLKLLDIWKDWITQKGGGTGLDWSEGSAAGPIWLGYRLSSTKSDDYYNLVYSKGAFVIHMLRMMLHDYTRHSDDLFVAMMSDFAKSFTGKKASTQDFIALTERHFKMEMDWFFNQWIFSTEIPTFRPQYNIIEQEGQYLVEATIKVENVSDSFQMVVPLVVEFENNSHTVLKFWVRPPETVYASKPLPYKPTNFIFNPYQAVLCHVK